MKKFATLMLLLAIAGGAHADLVLKTEKGGKHDFNVVPNALTTSGKTVFYTLSISSGEGNGDATVFSPDNGFAPKTFNIGEVEYQRGWYTEEAIVTLTGMNFVPEDERGYPNYSATSLWEASSQEEMIDKLTSLKEQTFTAFTDYFGNPACYGNTSFVLENLFGKQYPTSWYALIDGMIYSISTYSNSYTFAYDEESAVWTRTSESIDTYTNGCASIVLYLDGIEANEDNYITISQSLFNNDDKWEYLLPEYGPLSISSSSIQNVIDNGDGTVTLQRQVGVRSEETGFAVYNEDGTKLYNLRCTSDKGIFFYLDGDRAYYQSLEDGYICIYEINKETGDIDLVEKVQAKNDRKLGATRGIVTVDIDAEQAGGEVVVSTTDGKVMASKKVGIGQTQINDQPLPTGIYVVSLLKDGRVVESEKYLVQ